MSLVPYKVTAIKKTDPTGNNILAGASVSIVTTSGGFAQIWDDEAGTIPRSNPFTVDSNGERQIWINGGEYSVSVAGGQSWDIKLTGGSDILSIENVASMRALMGTMPVGSVLHAIEHTTGYGTSGGGDFVVTADTTSADNNGTTIVTLGGQRLKRTFTNYVTPYMFGAKGDFLIDDTDPIQDMFDSLSTAFDGFLRPGLSYFDSSTLDGPCAWAHFPRGAFKITEEINVPRGLLITGENARNHGGSRIKQFGTGGKYCFNLYGVLTANGQYIADQQIQHLFFSAVDGGGIRCFKPSGSGVFHSPGSLSVTNCFFLDITGPNGTQYAALDCDYLERCENNTFDAIEAIGLRAAHVSVCSGNTVFFSGRGGIILDLSRSYGAEQPATNIEGNAFISCGSAGLGGTGVYQGAVGILGTGPTSRYLKLSIKNNTIDGLASAGIHGVVGEDVILDGADIIDNTFTDLQGDPIRLDAAENCKIGNTYRRCGDSSDGVYMLGILGASINNYFPGNLFDDCSAATQNVFLGTGSTGNVFDGTIQDANRFTAPAGYGVRINDFVGPITNVVSLGSATNWQSLTYSNSWVDFSAPNAMQYRRDQNGIVVFRGSIKSGVIGNLVGTMPAGFRPKASSDVQFIVKAGNTSTSFGYVTINSAGEVYVLGVSDSSNARVSFDSVQYYAES